MDPFAIMWLLDLWAVISKHPLSGEQEQNSREWHGAASGESQVGHQEEALHQGRWWAWDRLPRAVGTAPSYWHPRSVYHSDICSDFWMVLWSRRLDSILVIPSQLEIFYHSMILSSSTSVATCWRDALALHQAVRCISMPVTKRVEQGSVNDWFLNELCLSSLYFQRRNRN